MNNESAISFVMIFFGIALIFKGEWAFIVGNIIFILCVSAGLFLLYIPSWAIKNRLFPYIHRPKLRAAPLLVAGASWLVFGILEMLAGDANIRVDLLYTLPVLIIITTTCILKWLFSFSAKTSVQ